ncbi:hypothetical protein ACVNPX_02345 [Staphylococcus aureus]
MLSQLHKVLLNHFQVNFNPTVINQAAGQVSTTKNALNGNENLEAAKQQASQSLGSLDNLNNAQKQTVTDQINGAHTVDEANQIKQNAQNLNTAMGNLKQAIADKDATKRQLTSLMQIKQNNKHITLLLQMLKISFQKLMAAMQHKLKLNKQSNKLMLQNKHL